MALRSCAHLTFNDDDEECEECRMGWAFCGKDKKGRDIGYGVAATCDQGGCEARIDRGLGFVCGGMHNAEYGEGCGGYFCGEHLFYVRGAEHQLCGSCADALEEVAPAREPQASGPAGPASEGAPHER